MKDLIAILALLTMTSCTSPNDLQYNEMLEPPATEQPEDSNPKETNTMKITIGETEFTATLATNTTVTAFKALLPLMLTMNDFNQNEKVCPLPSSLPTAASNSGIIRNGDIMLYGSSSLVLFYQTFSSSYSYTKIGTVDNPSGLQTALGSGSVGVKFEIQ